MHLTIFKKKKKKKHFGKSKFCLFPPPISRALTCKSQSRRIFSIFLFNFNMSNLLTCYLVMFAYATLKLFDERQQSSDSPGNVNC